MVRMGVPQLSIFHVKSHLQKIRLNERPANEKGARACVPGSTPIVSHGPQHLLALFACTTDCKCSPPPLNLH